MSSRRDDGQKRTLTYVVIVVATYAILSLSTAPDYASTLAGTEPSFGGSVAGLAFVVTRLLTIVVAPIGIIAVLLRSAGSWLVRRYAPSLRDDG